MIDDVSIMRLVLLVALVGMLLFACASPVDDGDAGADDSDTD